MGRQERLAWLNSVRDHWVSFLLPAVQPLAAIAACPDHFHLKSKMVREKTVRAGRQTLKLASLRSFLTEAPGSRFCPADWRQAWFHPQMELVGFPEQAQ